PAARDGAGEQVAHFVGVLGAHADGGRERARAEEAGGGGEREDLERVAALDFVEHARGAEQRAHHREQAEGPRPEDGDERGGVVRFHWPSRIVSTIPPGMTASPTPQQSQPGRSSFARSLAIYLDPRMIVILLLGFSSGLPFALSFSTLTVWLAEIG